MNRRRQQRLTRTLLTLTGLVLLALATCGVLLATKRIAHLGDLDARTGLLNPSGRAFLADQQLGLQLAGVGLGLLAIVIGTIWLKNQIPPIPRQDDQRLPTNASTPQTTSTIRGGALANALAADLESYPAIEHVRCEVRTDDDLILIRLDINDTTPIEPILQKVDTAVDRLARVAELDPRPSVETSLRLTGPPTRHVN